MEIDSSIRELRLFKGQGRWRFFMAWCLVFVRICSGPLVIFGVVLVLSWIAPGSWPGAIWATAVRAIKQLIW